MIVKIFGSLFIMSITISFLTCFAGLLFDLESDGPAGKILMSSFGTAIISLMIGLMSLIWI